MRTKDRMGLVLAAVAMIAGCAGRSEEITTSVIDSMEGSVAVPTSVESGGMPPIRVSSEEVEVALADIIARRVACGRVPRECQPDRIAVVGTDVHRSLTDLMADRVANGVVASSNGSLRYRIQFVSTTGDDLATARICFSDDTVLVQALPPQEGVVVPSMIVDDSLFSAVTDWELRRIDGEWLWAAEHSINWAMGEDLCVA